MTTPPAIDSVHSTLKELRELVDTKVSFSAEEKAKMEKMHGVLDKHEENSQSINLKMINLEKENKETKERLENFEKLIIMQSKKTPVDYKKSEEYKKFGELVTTGPMPKEMDAQTKAYLRTDVGPLGGYLVQDFYVPEILAKMQEISPVRALSLVRTIMDKNVKININDTLPESYYEGEGVPAPTSAPTYIQKTQTAHRHQISIPLTRDILRFTPMSMENEIEKRVITKFAQKEGRLFLLGTGVSQPQGILTRVGTGSDDIEIVDTATSLTLTFNDVINLSGYLKQGYNGVYFMNKKTCNYLRTLQSSTGGYLWTIGGEFFPNTIVGERYVIMQDMPNMVTATGAGISGALGIGFGDFFNGYNILDAIQMEIVRDEVTLAGSAKVIFHWYRWNDGTVVLPEAFKILRIKA